MAHVTRRTRMIRAVVTGLTLAALLGAAPSLSMPAGLRSFTGRLVQDVPAAISVENSGVRVIGYCFNRPLRKSGKLFGSDDEPTITLTVRNESDEPRDFTLAVALFDKEGNLVAAATEDPRGGLEPGEEAETVLTFHHVNRFASSASRLQMALEIQLD